MSMSFKGQTVVITGAGGGLGKAYSLLFASRGANVVVNDVSKEAAQKVVDEITRAGGKAIANASSVADGAAVIKAAVDSFGTVTVLINNAGILRDKSFKNMSDAEWDAVQLVHLKGAFSCTRAAWPIFRKQRFGRIINTSSAAGLYGNMGQANYSAAKMGLVAFTKTLALEGHKYNIHASVIAPMAASAMTATVMPPEMLEKLKPEFVAPLVAALTHPDGPDANGKIFEVGAGFVAEVRWEGSEGAVFKNDESFTPSAVKERWNEVIDFSHPQYPINGMSRDIMGKLEASKKMPSNKQSSTGIKYNNQTVIVTGGGGGLGKAYALMYARLGANVVVNDVSEKAAQAVVDEIKRAGGKAAAAVTSVEDGEGIVRVALNNFGGVHVLVANAGILRDRSFTSMSEKDWDDVIAVHLRGSYKCAKAVWPIFQKQKYGRIITTSSSTGIYGNFGQANYAAAKAALIGLARTLAIEGKRYNILVNAFAPTAGTAMTQTVWPQEMVDAFRPDYVAPVVGYLTSDSNTEITGQLFEICGGWAACLRWQRTGGHGFSTSKPLTPEDILSKWKAITNFEDGRATNPASIMESSQAIFDNADNVGAEDTEGDFFDPEDSEVVREAKKIIVDPMEYEVDSKQIILYNLGIGATEKQLKWVYEGDSDFEAIPTFGVIPMFGLSMSFPLDWLPNFNPAKLLHGEQFLAIKAPIPTSGTLVSTARLMEVQDKGKAAAVSLVFETKEKGSGQVIFENVMTTFVRGSGGFGGRKTGKDRGPVSAANLPPKRSPDRTVEERTTENQAALYRLSGDPNPLHILPEFAAIGGFDKPILHGLCFMGFAGKHVYETFGPYKDIKVRFAGVVYPGETLITEMWKEGNRVIFSMKTKERNTTVLSSAAVTLADESKARL